MQDATDVRVRGSVTTLETCIRWWISRSVQMLGLPVTDQEIERLADRVLEDANLLIARELLVYGRETRPWMRDAA